MNAWRGYKVWLHALLQPGTLFALAMIAAIWIGMALVTSIERDKLLEGAIQQSDSFVRALKMIPSISTCAIGQIEPPSWVT
jgi:hypothetical protein